MITSIRPPGHKLHPENLLKMYGIYINRVRVTANNTQA
ncbi:Uncharacterised protein [Alistipes sp. cv1]|nr:Uncharacterised protein [Faecalibacterium prausnitzii]